MSNSGSVKLGNYCKKNLALTLHFKRTQSLFTAWYFNVRIMQTELKVRLCLVSP